MLTDQEKFDLANDIKFAIAIDDAQNEAPLLQKVKIRTIGDRIRLIEHLEKNGFEIKKKQK